MGESRERENSLDIKISQLECELTASTKRVDQLQSTEQELNDQLRNLTEKLSELRTKDSDREKNNVEALRLVEEMCRSRVALERMIEFVQNALLAQFSDPALLFTVSKGGVFLFSDLWSRRCSILVRNGSYHVAVQLVHLVDVCGLECRWTLTLECTITFQMMKVCGPSRKRPLPRAT